MRALRRSLVVMVMLALVGAPGAPGAVAASDGDEPMVATPDVGPGVVFGPEAQEDFDSLAEGNVVVFNDFEDIPTGLHRKLRLDGPDGSISVGLRTTKFRWPPPPRGAPARAPVAMLPYDFVKEPTVHRLMGVVKTRGPKGKWVPDGQSRFELVLDPPVSHVGFMRPWNTWSVTRFYDAAGGLLAKHRNTVDHQFVGYVADAPEKNVGRIVLDGVPSQPDDEYNKLYMAGTIEDLYLSGGRPDADAAQSPADPSAGGHPDDMVIDAPGGPFEGLSDPEAGEPTDDGETPDRSNADPAGIEPERRVEAVLRAFGVMGIPAPFVGVVDAENEGTVGAQILLFAAARALDKVQAQLDGQTGGEDTSALQKQSRDLEGAIYAIGLYLMLRGDDGGAAPAAPGSGVPAAAVPAAEQGAKAEAGTVESAAVGPAKPEADASDSVTEPVLPPPDLLIGVTNVGSPIGYDAIDSLSEGTGGSSDTSADATDPARPQDPPPQMKSKHAQAGRTWVSLDAEHEVRKVVPKKVDPKTKKPTGWKVQGKVTLQPATWYQMKQKKKALIFYDTTGKPVGVAGKAEKRGLQYEPWTPPAGESP